VIKELSLTMIKSLRLQYIYVRNKLFGKGIGNYKKEDQHFAAKQAVRDINRAVDIINSV